MNTTEAKTLFNISMFVFFTSCNDNANQLPGRLISREELFDAVWQETIVEDTALRLAVNALRKALHDDSKTPHFILTACKRSYRFLPEVNIQHSSQGNLKKDQPNSI